MGRVEVLTGNYAAAWGARLSRVKVVAAYPITPQTSIVEKIAEFVEKGEMDAKLIRVESEHSAMAAVIGAAATGVRTFTATSSQGLLYMHEMVWWAAGARLPVVMAVVTRALAPPWSIWSEHTDVMAQRDTGWLIVFAEDNQEVLDTVIMSYRVSEDERVLLPSMVVLDAFILSHTVEPVEIPDQELVDGFLFERPNCGFKLDPSDPLSHGGIVFPDRYMEFRYLIDKGMTEARRVIREVVREYAKLTGRDYHGLVEPYRCEDAEVVMVLLGAWAGTAKEAVDRLRDKGVRVGLLRIRYMRPFPVDEIKRYLSGAKAVVVLDRSVSFGRGGVLGVEVSSCLYAHGVRKPVVNVIAGLGGRDVFVDDMIKMFNMGFEAVERGVEGMTTLWYGLSPDVEVVV